MSGTFITRLQAAGKKRQVRTCYRTYQKIIEPWEWVLWGLREEKDLSYSGSFIETLQSLVLCRCREGRLLKTPSISCIAMSFIFIGYDCPFSWNSPSSYHPGLCQHEWEHFFLECYQPTSSSGAKVGAFLLPGFPSLAMLVTHESSSVEGPFSAATATCTTVLDEW